ncbi:MAG: biotin/lipoyl-containing protein, partial [Pseudomonadota bacterium]|nr:biotin/lipoyl-containing protein [Pseudomonadota bacterium]
TTREEALNRLGEALSDCQIAGSVTNLNFLVALSRHKGFAAGQVDTGLIDRELTSLLEQGPTPAPVLALAAVGGLGLLDDRPSPDPWAQLIGWRHWSEAVQHVELEAQGEGLSFAVSVLGALHFRVQGGGIDLSLSVTPTSSKTRFDLRCEGSSFSAGLVRNGNSIAVFADGRSFGFEVPDPLVQVDAAGVAANAIQAPMPGLVQQVFAQAGQAVTQGDPLLVLEAMKMEHRLTAPRDGVVLDVLAAVGDQVNDGTALVTLEPVDD